MLRTPQREQRVAAQMQRVDVAGLQRERPVETLERLLIALERMQNDPEIDPCIRRAGIDLERRGDEPVGLSGLSALRLDGAEKVERVELIRQRLEYAGIDLLRLAQPPLLLQRHGLLQRLPEIWRRATGNRHRRGWHVSGEQRSGSALVTVCITSIPRAGEQRSPGSCHRAAFLLRSQQLQASITVAFSLGPGWRAFGPAVIRVRTAKSAVASDHLLHAHFVGWQTAIVMKGMARTSARAPRHLSGLADAKVEQHCHRYGHHDEHESHGRLHPDDTGRFVPRSLSSRSNAVLPPGGKYKDCAPFHCPLAKALRSRDGCVHLAL